MHLPVQTDSAGTVVGDKVFYANTDVDTDWMVSPTPLGVAVAAQLRSAASPHRLDLGFDVPEGAVLRADARGGVEVARDGTVIAKVTPPVVVDAAGEQIPARYETAGNTIVITVDEVADAEYPLLVDPVIDSAQWQTTAAGTEGWQYGAANVGFAPGYGSPWGRGLVIGSGWGNYYDHTAWAWWNYRAPGGSHIYRADYNGLIQQVHDPARPVCYTLGVNQLNVGWAPDSWNYGLGPWAPHISERGPFVRCGGVVNVQVANCANIYCNDTTGTNAAGMQQWMYGGLHRYDWNRTYLAGATVYLSDREHPSLTGSATPGTRFADEAAVTFNAQDSGLGVKKVRIWSPTFAGWNQAKTLDYPCYGTSWSACETRDQPGTIVVGNLPNGNHTIRVEVWDAGNKHTYKDWTVTAETDIDAIEARVEADSGLRHSPLEDWNAANGLEGGGDASAAVGPLLLGGYALCTASCATATAAGAGIVGVASKVVPRAAKLIKQPTSPNPAWSLAQKNLRGSNPSRTLGNALQAGKQLTAQEMRAAGKVAHHIVATGDLRAEYARFILYKYGVKPNDAANGVWMCARQHCGLHTNAYYWNINKSLKQFEHGPWSRDFVEKHLQKLGKALDEGKIPT